MTTRNWAYRLANIVRRDLLPTDANAHVHQVADVLGALFYGILALVGIIWLVGLTDWSIFYSHWWLFLLFGLLWAAIERLNFYIVADFSIREDPGYANSSGSFEPIARWSAILILGPEALWIGILISLVTNLPSIFRAGDTNLRWTNIRTLVSDLVTESLTSLFAFTIYTALGGSVPFGELTPAAFLAFMAALAGQLFLEVILLIGYLGYIFWAMRGDLDKTALQGLLVVLVVGVGAPFLPMPFAPLAAWLFFKGGLAVYLFFMLGLAMVAFITRQLSRANERSRQGSRQLQRLERLGRALLESPPDASNLAEILNAYIPGIFLSQRMAIWLSPDQYLLTQPKESDPDAFEPIWSWLLVQRGASVFTQKEPLPWMSIEASHPPVVVTPILDAEDIQPQGGIFVELQTTVDWDRRALLALLPTLQALAAQITSTLHQAEVYQKTLAYQKTIQELAFARSIQASFLPERLPDLPGWQLAAMLQPALETSGDFYDFIPLSNGCLGILIADVADKGLGPALYMALSRTLIRTYAQQLDTPEEVLSAANRRILEDSSSDLFVTVFYGILNPQENWLMYCNAGHSPAFLFNRSEGDLNQLGNTGMALGVLEDAPLRQSSVKFGAGDILVLYTDGVTDAQNAQGEFIDAKKLIFEAQREHAPSALAIQNHVLEQIQKFVAGAPQFDDITLIVLCRDMLE